jgi:hypothetical protein
MRNLCRGKRWQQWIMRAVERDSKARAAAKARVNADGCTLH